MRGNHMAQQADDFAREIDPEEVAALDRAGEPDMPAGMRARAAKVAALMIPPPPMRVGAKVIPAPAMEEESSTPPLARKGRGAVTNPPSRFDAQTGGAFDDGWDTLAADFSDLPPLPTTLLRDTTRKYTVVCAPGERVKGNTNCRWTKGRDENGKV